MGKFRLVDIDIRRRRSGTVNAGDGGRVDESTPDAIQPGSSFPTVGVNTRPWSKEMVEARRRGKELLQEIEGTENRFNSLLAAYRDLAVMARDPEEKEELQRSVNEVRAVFARLNAKFSEEECGI